MSQQIRYASTKRNIKAERRVKVPLPSDTSCIICTHVIVNGVKCNTCIAWMHQHCAFEWQTTRRKMSTATPGVIELQCPQCRCIIGQTNTVQSYATRGRNLQLRSTAVRSVAHTFTERVESFMTSEYQQLLDQNEAYIADRLKEQASVSERVRECQALVDTHSERLDTLRREYEDAVKKEMDLARAHARLRDLHLHNVGDIQREINTVIDAMANIRPLNDAEDLAEVADASTNTNAPRSTGAPLVQSRIGFPVVKNRFERHRRESNDAEIAALAGGDIALDDSLEAFEGMDDADDLSLLGQQYLLEHPEEEAKEDNSIIRVSVGDLLAQFYAQQPVPTLSHEHRVVEEVPVPREPVEMIVPRRRVVAPMQAPVVQNLGPRMAPQDPVSSRTRSKRQRTQ